VRYKGTSVPRMSASGYDSNNDAWSVHDPNVGLLFRGNRFTSTQPVRQWITPQILPMAGRQDWSVDYTGGYLMPGDNLVASGVMSALASDNSFNLPEDDTLYFPILVAGETVRMTGFTNAENNGKATVVSRTPTKLVVTKTLTDEDPASGVVRMQCQTLPAELERRCLDTVKFWFITITRDMSITNERLGDWIAGYASASFLAADNYGLPPTVTAGLQNWTRVGNA
jgi:hypothetical protein